MTDSDGKLTPIFLFSLRRSGSTLLQRILAAHNDITTANEPHILLPLIYATKERGVYSEYDHRITAQAIRDFFLGFSNGEEDFLTEIREFALRLYSMNRSKNVEYFVDKTPFYHLIVEDVINLFPDAKFIFLWRNPLSVVSSIMETWRGGGWLIYQYEIDLFQGLLNLINAYQRFSDRVFAVATRIWCFVLRERYNKCFLTWKSHTTTEF